MLKHCIVDDQYYIYDDKDPSGEIIFNLKLDNTVEGNQVIITVNDEVFAGPLKLLNLSKID